MNIKLKSFEMYFIQLAAAALLLFVLGALFGKPIVNYLYYMNDGATTKTFFEWVRLGLGGGFATTVWSLLWLWFKRSEKHCLELLDK